MNETLNSNIFRKYTLDYLGKYHFYEEDELVRLKKDGEYILDNLKKSNRFDYDKATYTFTKFGNISEGRTEKDVVVEIKKENIDVNINGKTTHLDLIYKMEVKKLEDHYRIATRISEKADSVSSLLYINLRDGEDFIKALEEIKKYQENLSNKNTIK